jgi:hypothetical protein
MGKAWYDNVTTWSDTRFTVAETFTTKAIVNMVEDDWVTKSGRSDLEGLKLSLAKEQGRRDVAM